MRQFFFVVTLVFAKTISVFSQPTAIPQLKLSASRNPSYLHTSITPSLSLAKKDSISALPIQSHLPLDYYAQHLGAACKMELQLEKQTKLPIRLRLGSKEQVDYLEGKFSKNH